MASRARLYAYIHAARSQVNLVAQSMLEIAESEAHYIMVMLLPECC